MPPSGPTSSRISPSARATAARGASRAASASRTIAQAAADARFARAAVLASSVTSGSQARRDCLAASRAVARHLARALLAPLGLPLRDRALGRPRDHGVDADLGHQLDRELAPVALGERLRDGQPRLRRRDRAHGPDVERDRVLADDGDHALGERPRAVADVRALARPQPPDGRRVVSLGAGQRHRTARSGRRAARGTPAGLRPACGDSMPARLAGAVPGGLPLRVVRVPGAGVVQRDPAGPVVRRAGDSASAVRAGPWPGRSPGRVAVGVAVGARVRPLTGGGSSVGAWAAASRRARPPRRRAWAVASPGLELVDGRRRRRRRCVAAGVTGRSPTFEASGRRRGRRGGLGGVVGRGGPGWPAVRGGRGWRGLRGWRGRRGTAGSGAVGDRLGRGGGGVRGHVGRARLSRPSRPSRRLAVVAPVAPLALVAVARRSAGLRGRRAPGGRAECGPAACDCPVTVAVLALAAWPPSAWRRRRRGAPPPAWVPLPSVPAPPRRLAAAAVQRRYSPG